MNRLTVFLPLLAAFLLLVVSIASADPRMEINKDFCHFILDPNDTDNEVFVADCAAVISTLVKVEPAGALHVQCEDNRIANGYAALTRVVHQTVSPIPPGTTLSFTSADSGTPCTMVESNNRAYTSTKWQSTIRAGTPRRGLVNIQYELLCQEGE